MKNHICKEDRSCICSILADEPDEECPVHGGCFVRPTCEICGRFMKWTENPNSDGACLESNAMVQAI